MPLELERSSYHTPSYAKLGGGLSLSNEKHVSAAILKSLMERKGATHSYFSKIAGEITVSR